MGDAELTEGDIVTISGIGVNASGDTVVRSRRDNKQPPFWGVNERTGKRNKAIKLLKLKIKG